MGTHAGAVQDRVRPQTRRGKRRKSPLPKYLSYAAVLVMTVVVGSIFFSMVHKEYPTGGRPAPHYGAAFKTAYVYAVQQIDNGNTPRTVGMSARLWCNSNTGSYQYTAPVSEDYYHGCLAAIGRQNLFGLHPVAGKGY